MTYNAAWQCQVPAGGYGDCASGSNDPIGWNRVTANVPSIACRWSNGTTVYFAPVGSFGQSKRYEVGSLLYNTRFSDTTGQSVQTHSRMTYSFPIAAVAATTTTQWREQQAVKARTVENVTFNVGAFNCSVNPAISLFDCSATRGTCTPVATLATSGTLTGIGSTAPATTPTANVAAGE